MPHDGSEHRLYSAFSLAPTLLIVLAILGWSLGDDVGKGRFFEQVKGIMGAEAAGAMQVIVERTHRSQGGGLAAMRSVVPDASLMQNWG